MAETIKPWEKRQTGPWEKYQAATDSLPILDDPAPLPDMADFGKTPREELGLELAETGLDALAIADVAKTVVSGAVSSILVSTAGAVNMLFGADPDKTADQVRLWTERGTSMPWSDRGQDLLEAIAPPLMALEEGSDELSWRLSMGNPYAATFIKTSLLGGLELLLPAKGAMNTMKAKRLIGKQMKEVRAIADRLKIPLSQENMSSGVIELAKRMTPDERAQNMPFLRQMMREAEARSKAKKNKAYEDARQTKTWVDTRAVNDLSNSIRAELNEFGYDLADMPIVQKRLADLSPETPMTRANLAEFEKIRKRVNANRSASPSENSALGVIKKRMDEFLDNEFDEIAIASGRSAISGDAAGLQAWKSARQANIRWRQNFSEDKVIANLISKEATPERYREWLMGASAMGVRKEASQTITRMKQVLGDNHPAIEGIRQDFLFEVVDPLIKVEPNFRQFVRNYDTMVRRNPELVKALDLRAEDLTDLNNFAILQTRLPANTAIASFKDIRSTAARLFVGHQIAKAQVRVAWTANALHLVFGMDRIGKKRILYEMAGLKYGEVLIPKQGPLAAQFIAGAALASTPTGPEKESR